MDGFTRLIEEQYFSVDRFDLAGGAVHVGMATPGCLVGLKSSGSVNGVEFKAGQAIIVPAGSGEVLVESRESFSFARCLATIA